MSFILGWVQKLIQPYLDILLATVIAVCVAALIAQSFQINGAHIHVGKLQLLNVAGLKDQHVADTKALGDAVVVIRRVEGERDAQAEGWKSEKKNREVERQQAITSYDHQQDTCRAAIKKAVAASVEISEVSRVQPENPGGGADDSIGPDSLRIIWGQSPGADAGAKDSAPEAGGLPPRSDGDAGGGAHGAGGRGGSQGQNPGPGQAPGKLPDVLGIPRRLGSEDG